jgi:hypothetical protein
MQIERVGALTTRNLDNIMVFRFYVRFGQRGTGREVEVTDRPVTLLVTPEALTVLECAAADAARLALMHGDDSREHREAMRSLIRVLLSVLHLGGRLGWTDEHCLTGLSEDGRTYEVVFHHWRSGQQPTVAAGVWSLHT